MPCEQFGQVEMLFSMSNANRNTISQFERDCSGALRFVAERYTGGSGTGLASVDPLGSQGSLIVSKCRRNVYVVNAGDNTVSSFRLDGYDLVLTGVVSSGGVMPVSLAIHGDLLYVVNAGNAVSAANVTGFHIGDCGQPIMIPNSTRHLSAPNASPACAVFRPDGRLLVVSEKATGILTAFPVRQNGTLATPVMNPSHGATPFGMTFTRHSILLVTEVGPNALSSYSAASDGTLSVISGSVPNGQAATCWVSATPDGRNAYTSDAGSGTLSQYRVLQNGGLTLLANVPSTPLGTGAPLDSAIDSCGNFLYVLNGAQGSISVLMLDPTGHATLVQIFQNTQLPKVGAQGMALL